MRNPAVQDMYPVYTVPDSRGTIVQLGQHTAADNSAVNQFLRLAGG